jgi:hypothetical protein
VCALIFLPIIVADDVRGIDSHLFRVSGLRHEPVRPARLESRYSVIPDKCFIRGTWRNSQCLTMGCLDKLSRCGLLSGRATKTFPLVIGQIASLTPKRGEISTTVIAVTR